MKDLNEITKVLTVENERLRKGWQESMCELSTAQRDRAVVLALLVTSVVLNVIVLWRLLAW